MFKSFFYGGCTSTVDKKLALLRWMYTVKLAFLRWMYIHRRQKTHLFTVDVYGGCRLLRWMYTVDVDFYGGCKIFEFLIFGF